MHEVVGASLHAVARRAWALSLAGLVLPPLALSALALAFAVALCPPGQSRAAEVDELLQVGDWLHGPPAVRVPVVRLPGDVGTPEQWAAKYPAPPEGTLNAYG